MKNQIVIIILASLCMAIAQIMEIIAGPTVTGVAFNMIAFLGFSIGIWGLHRRQTQEKPSGISLAGTILLTVGGLALAAVSLQIIQDISLSVSMDFIASPIFMIAAACIGLGTILFGVAVIRIHFFPIWAGLLLLLIPLVNIATETIWQTVVVRNYLNILLAAVFIYLAVLSLRSKRTIHQA